MAADNFDIQGKALVILVTQKLEPCYSESWSGSLPRSDTAFPVLLYWRMTRGRVIQSCVDVSLSLDPYTIHGGSWSELNNIFPEIIT